VVKTTNLFYADLQSIGKMKESIVYTDGVMMLQCLSWLHSLQLHRTKSKNKIKTFLKALKSNLYQKVNATVYNYKNTAFKLIPQLLVLDSVTATNTNRTTSTINVWQGSAGLSTISTSELNRQVV